MVIPLPENRKVTRNQFHVFFGRYEIPIQAFVHFINGQIIHFQSSAPHFSKLYSTFIFKTYISKHTFQKHIYSNTKMGMPFKMFEHFEI